MITYVYECDSCGHIMEAQQSIKDEALVQCPSCNESSLHRVIQTPMYVRVMQEPTTVGQLAERNAKGMSNDEQKLRLEAQKTQKTIQRIPEDRMPARVAPADTSEPTPEWLTKPRTKTNTEINKMSPEKVERYIHTGE